MPTPKHYWTLAVYCPPSGRWYPDFGAKTRKDCVDERRAYIEGGYAKAKHLKIIKTAYNQGAVDMAIKALNEETQNV